MKAEKYLKGTGLADTAYFGPEAEFFVFDEVRYEQTPYSAFYAIDSVEGSWNTGRDERPNLGYKPRTKEGYFPAPPTDSLVALRQEMVIELQNVGIRVEAEHHEVASGGQCEIDMRFSPLVQMADNLNWFKYIIKNVARRHNKTVTFMPKPIFEDNGSGMHVHQSLWKDGRNLFAGEGYAGISEIGMWYIGGIIHHAPALVAITNPTTNSYKLWSPGSEPPPSFGYSGRNRSAAIRIPMVSSNPKAKRIEFARDPSCNGYLAFAAMLMAGLDGIEAKMDPRAARQGYLRPASRRAGPGQSVQAVSTGRSTPWPRITPSCCAATSLPKMSSRIGSSTSTTKKFRLYGCARRLTSSSSTSTPDGLEAPCIQVGR
jgi:glutamine synthetase